MVLPGIQLAPEANGIRINDIRFEGLKLLIEKAVHTERNTDILYRHFRRGHFLQPGFFLFRQFRQMRITGDIFCACSFDFVFKVIKGIESDVISTLHQLSGNREHGICMPMRGNAEKEDLFHFFSPS